MNIQDIVTPGHLLAMKALHSIGKPYQHIADTNYPDIDKDALAAFVEERIAVVRSAPDLPVMSPKRHRRATLWCAGASLQQIGKFCEVKQVSKQTIYQDVHAAVEPGTRATLARKRMFVSDEQVIALGAAYAQHASELIELGPPHAAERLWSEYAGNFIEE